MSPVAHIEAGEAHASARHATRRGRSRLYKFLGLLAIGVVAGGIATRLGYSPEDLGRIPEAIRHAVTPAPPSPGHKPIESPPQVPWDGLVTLDRPSRDALGVRIVEAKLQVAPIELTLNGTTDYDQNTLVKVRPLFDARVQKVFKANGDPVRKGEPLLELFSNDLAAAKNDLRKRFVQWDHDRKLLETRRPLAANGSITQILWVDTVNDEKRSRLEYLQTRDRLLVYKLTTAEIDGLLKGLGDGVEPKDFVDDTQDISRMVLESPIDGVIVDRDAVAGNYYDATSVLMVISPMDTLWVWGNAYEGDQNKIRLGLSCRVQFPFLKEDVPGSVESIANRLDAASHTLRVRMSVKNPDKHLKADMLVRAILNVPPHPGQTVIPRNAMTVINGKEYVFVQAPTSDDKFERREVIVDQERAESTTLQVAKKDGPRTIGLMPGEKIVTNGSLILGQLYEDRSTVESGLPSE